TGLGGGPSRRTCPGIRVAELGYPRLPLVGRSDRYRDGREHRAAWELLDLATQAPADPYRPHRSIDGSTTCAGHGWRGMRGHAGMGAPGRNRTCDTRFR